ncbi:porin family protein [Mariniphaga sp.]|uniref:type IX secretion/gliding motility protein PorT/SprT n=1 Tax=Mariniphaga sp. TaxID=1954475 RepID=UPI00356ABBFA
MKKISLAILTILIAFSAFSQKQKVNHMTTFDDKLIHFGFTLGINTLDFGLAHYNPIGNNPDFVPENWPLDKKQIVGSDEVRADVSSLIPGFTVGIISSLRLTRDLDLRFLPGLSFGERQLHYNIPVWETDYYQPLQYYSIKSTFLDFPLLIKYKARRINNDRPYIIFGPAYRQDISRTGKEDLVRLKSGGFYAELGAGWDHYFTFFRFSVEAKVSLGLNNLLGAPPSENQRQYYTHAIKDLKSNIFTFSFHFE